MNETIRSYRGLEIYPLVYPRKARGKFGSYDYDAGFDASVKICRRDDNDALSAGLVFRVPQLVPFGAAGEARRACATYAEQIIDGRIAGQSVSEL